MQNNYKGLVHYIKSQSEAFIKEIEDFYPFGATISLDGQLKPLGAYLDEDELSVEALITMLEANIKSKLKSGIICYGAIAFSVIIREANQVSDAIQVNLYEKDDTITVYYYKYLSNQNTGFIWL